MTVPGAGSCLRGERETDQLFQVAVCSDTTRREGLTEDAGLDEQFLDCLCRECALAEPVPNAFQVPLDGLDPDLGVGRPRLVLTRPPLFL